MDLELSIVISQIFAFLIVLWILKRFAWKPFAKLLANRQAKIEAEFHSIDQQKLKLQTLTDEYQMKLSQIELEAKEMVQRAALEAEKVAKRTTEAAQKQAKEIIENAKKAIDQELFQARHTLQEKIVHLVIEASEKLIEEKMDPEKEKYRIDQFVKSLE